MTRVHHERSCTVATNDPVYEDQLVNLARYRPFGGELPLPGDILSPDRFVRASYFLHYLPEPQTYAEALAGLILIARNVAVPPGAPTTISPSIRRGGSARSTSPTSATTSKLLQAPI